jgi:ABC-2 type transport system ATP-binding protein
MLELSGLSKRYGPVVALDGCTFTVRPGRITGFLGPNAADKTTAIARVPPRHLLTGKVAGVGLPAQLLRWRRRTDMCPPPPTAASWRGCAG